MVMSSFDEAKFSAWGFWSSLVQPDEAEPLLKIGARLASSTKKQAKHQYQTERNTKNICPKMAKKFFTERIYRTVLTSLLVV